MKKTVTLMLVLMLVCLCAACGRDEKNAGSWALRGIETEGLLTEPEVLGLSASLELEKDGSGRLTIDESGYAIKSWSVKDGAVSIKTLDGTVEGRLAEGYIVLTFEDGISLWFAKDGANVLALTLLDEAGYRAALEALIASGDVMPAD